MQDVEVQLKGSANGSPAPLEETLDDSGFVDFAVTGYGAVVQRVLPPCPMCGGTVWETRPPRFAD